MIERGMGIKCEGIVTIEQIRQNETILRATSYNTECNVGKTKVANLMAGLVSTGWNYIAIGTGTVATAATDTALTVELVRVQTSNSITTGPVSANDTATYFASFQFATLSSTVNITEAGIFDASSGGTILAHVLLSSTVSVVNGDQLNITWNQEVQG